MVGPSHPVSTPDELAEKQQGDEIREGVELIDFREVWKRWEYIAVGLLHEDKGQQDDRWNGESL
jgi:hypothetical protein